LDVAAGVRIMEMPVFTPNIHTVGLDIYGSLETHHKENNPTHLNFLCYWVVVKSIIGTNKTNFPAIDEKRGFFYAQPPSRAYIGPLPFPQDPCMVYLPTFTILIHVWYIYLHLPF